MKILFITLVATMGFGATFITIVNSKELTKIVTEEPIFLKDLVENIYD
jgi:hypothetical protein